MTLEILLQVHVAGPVAFVLTSPTRPDARAQVIARHCFGLHRGDEEAVARVQLTLAAASLVSALSHGQQPAAADALRALPAELQQAGDEYPELTLDEALSYAYGSGYTVQSQQAVVAQGEALQREAQARWRPQVNVSAHYTMNDDRIEVTFPNPYAALEPWLATVSAANPALPPASVLTEPPETVLVSQLRHDVRGVLTVTQPLYQPVSAPLREQGEAVEAAAVAGTEATRQGVRDAVESLWFQAIRFRQVQQVAGRNVERATLNLRRAQQASELGVAQAFDVRRAKFALTQAQTAYASAGAGYRAAREQLAGALSMQSDFEPAAPPTLDPHTVLALGVTAWSSRPEVLADEYRATSVEANADVARATRLPFANVSATVTPHTTTDFQDDAVDWFIQVGVQWNAWDGGVRRAQSERLAAQAEQVRWQAADTARQFEAHHAAARMSLLDAINRQTQAQAQVALATSEYDTLNEAFSAGAASRLEVDSALLRRFEAETLLAVAEVDVQAAAYLVRRLARWER